MFGFCSFYHIRDTERNRIMNLCFASDIDLIIGSTNDQAVHGENLYSVSCCHDMEISLEKTKIMVSGRTPTSQVIRSWLLVNADQEETEVDCLHSEGQRNNLNCDPSRKELKKPVKQVQLPCQRTGTLYMLSSVSLRIDQGGGWWWILFVLHPWQ